MHSFMFHFSMLLQAFVENFGSTGTRVNDRLLLNPSDRLRLQSGDVLTIGERKFIFEYPETQPTVATEGAALPEPAEVRLSQHCRRSYVCRHKPRRPLRATATRLRHLFVLHLKCRRSL